MSRAICSIYDYASSSSSSLLSKSYVRFSLISSNSLTLRYNSSIKDGSSWSKMSFVFSGKAPLRCILACTSDVRGLRLLALSLAYKADGLFDREDILVIFSPDLLTEFLVTFS